MTRISDALTAYRICAKAEGKSPRTIGWVTSSVGYFARFLGGDPDISSITADDLRRFIITLQNTGKFRNHPFNRPQETKISALSIQTYCRGIRAFFGSLLSEGLIEANPVASVRMPRAPTKVVPTFSEQEIQRLLANPDRKTDIGFTDYTLMLTYLDTSARLSELVNMSVGDIDLENGYIRVLGKDKRERYLPIGQKVAKALLKYQLNHRHQAVGNDRFWLTQDGQPLTPNRVEKIIGTHGRKAGLPRCYPHKLRHTSSVMYLRNGGDPFTLQKKLGHSSLQMTRHYCNLADSDVRAAHLKFGVADRLKI
ncbi:MAG: tyrosine-type recombinase/integrase [Dehalococcoidia bacterium]|nr:tyrosine-type recombinase/integrase [Dehalococcoidia bacterium]